MVLTLPSSEKKNMQQIIGLDRRPRKGSPPGSLLGFGFLFFDLGQSAVEGEPSQEQNLESTPPSSTESCSGAGAKLQ